MSPADFRCGGRSVLPTTGAGRRDHALLLVAVETGLRCSELAGLRIESLVLGRGAYVRWHGKGRKERCTPLHKPTVAVLRGWLRERGEAPSDPLFPNARGEAPKVDRKSLLDKAIHYWTRQQPFLGVFLDDGRLPISNAHAERLLRVVAHVPEELAFVGSLEAGERYANLLTVLLNCELAGVNPTSTWSTSSTRSPPTGLPGASTNCFPEPGSLLARPNSRLQAKLSPSLPGSSSRTAWPLSHPRPHPSQMVAVGRMLSKC